MTIKARLIFTFTIFVSIIVLMGGILILFGMKNKGLSEKSLKTYAELSRWREIQRSFGSQCRSLKYVASEKNSIELDKFWDEYKIINAKLEDISAPSNKIIDWKTKIV